MATVKKCKPCGRQFEPFNPLQKSCSPRCAIDLAVAQKAKKAAQVKAVKKKAFKDNDRPYQMALAQKAFNAFIRERDKGQPCISCGTTADVQYAAGHWKSRGSSPHLRFNQFNVNLQCNRYCNLGQSGNVGEYRIGLINKFGIKKVEWLESQNVPVKWSINEIRAIKQYYRKLLKVIKQ